MACYAPLTGFYSNEVNASGKRSLTFKRQESFSGVAVRVPCGQCIGCRLERSRQWAMRMMHEKLAHDRNVFLTLTYDDAHLPSGGSLVKRDLQLFMKRLRKEKCDDRIRFYACGEYGSLSRRPHYHVVLFGTDFSDASLISRSSSGHHLYSSACVRRLWPCGFNVLAQVNFETCAYVARYVCDKLTGAAAGCAYVSSDGEVLEPEFSLMSRRPGIGMSYFERYGKHVYQLDSVSVNGKDVRPPRFYDLAYEKLDAAHMAVLKRRRRVRALAAKEDNTPERRRVREHVTLRGILDRAKKGV